MTAETDDDQDQDAPQIRLRLIDGMGRSVPLHRLKPNDVLHIAETTYRDDRSETTLDLLARWYDGAPRTGDTYQWTPAQEEHIREIVRDELRKLQQAQYHSARRPGSYGGGPTGY